jgi:hypothetical protein
VWFLLFRRYRLPDFSPFPNNKRFFECWIQIIAFFPEDFKHGLNSLITLGAWMLWKHCNDCVLNGVVPNIQLVVRNILEEAQLWCIAGTQGLAQFVVAAR